MRQPPPSSHRDALCEWGCDAVWLDPAEDAANIRWAREVAEAMLPFTTGSDYVNHIGLEAEEGTDRIRPPSARITNAS